MAIFFYFNYFFIGKMTKMAAKVMKKSTTRGKTYQAMRLIIRFLLSFPSFITRSPKGIPPPSP